MTPAKGHNKNLVTSYLSKKYPIHWRETSEPHGSKSFYTGSDNSHTERSHDEYNIENYGFCIIYPTKTKEMRNIKKERKTRLKTLKKIHSQNNVIRHTLKNIMSIDEKINQAKKYDVNINKPRKWE